MMQGHPGTGKTTFHCMTVMGRSDMSAQRTTSPMNILFTVVFRNTPGIDFIFHLGFIQNDRVEIHYRL